MLLGGDQRPELRAGVEARSEPRRVGRVGERAHHLVEALRRDEQARAGVARLPGVEVDRLEGALDGGVDVGVGQDDVRRLATELERHALERPARLGADLTPDRGRAGEGDLVDARVVDERGAGARRRRSSTFSTPGGNPTSSASSPIRSALNGVCSAGLSTIVQPAARAGPSFHAAISSGKFHGMICAHTPTGSRRV